MPGLKRGTIFLTLIAFCLTAALSSCSSRVHKNDADAAGELRVYKDLSYAPGSKDPFQTLDLYLPRHPKQEPVPLIVWIHGGAWMSGDKNHPPLLPILDRGYAVASLNYRLSSQAVHPAQINDCKAAIRFLRKEAKLYDLDPARIGVWGHSAGGHLAALLGTSGGVKELEGELGNNEFSSRVQAVADWAGPTDLLTVGSQAPKNCRIDFSSPTNPVAVFLGENRSPTAYLAASPIQYASPDDPPVLILHAEDDDIVPVGQSREFSELLKKQKVTHELLISPEGGHALSRSAFVNRTMDFFDKYLCGN
ncbi:MAG: alpha/beta hydrolase [Candidatus Obscuribacterales bacterium]|nr:alpha/beta hydrolase [Candidatus Obscuribacterales bacterium]